MKSFGFLFRSSGFNPGYTTSCLLRLWSNYVTESQCPCLLRFPLLQIKKKNLFKVTWVAVGKNGDINPGQSGSRVSVLSHLAILISYTARFPSFAWERGNELNEKVQGPEQGGRFCGEEEIMIVRGYIIRETTWYLPAHSISFSK